MDCGAGARARRAAASYAPETYSPRGASLARAHARPRGLAVRQLGHGHEGVVWLVRDDAGGESAVKLVRRGFTSFYAAAVADEVATLQRLSAGGGHVHVTPASALWLSPSHLAIQMAFAPGGTLERYVARHGRHLGAGAPAKALPGAEAAYFAHQLLSALAFCHSRRIVFRDVKPENCVLDGASPPRLALCDFGVSRAFSKKAPKLSMHTIAGTPGFIAPQVLNQMFVRGASAGYDGRAADVWSAGAVLCQLLTGQLPYGFEEELECTLDARAALHRVWAAARAAPVRGFVSDAAHLDDMTLGALEAMMACDEAERPSAKGCLELPWFGVMKARMPPPFRAALDAAAAEQARVEEAHAADPPRRLGAHKTAPGEWRDDRMRAFVGRAAKAAPGEPVDRMTLLQEVGESVPSPNGSDFAVSGRISTGDLSGRVSAAGSSPVAAAPASCDGSP